MTTRDLLPDLRDAAHKHAAASKMMADARSAEYRARGDVDASYDWEHAEQTLYWRAADEIERLRARIADLEEYAHLTEYWGGLEPPDQKERRVYINKLFLP